MNQKQIRAAFINAAGRYGSPFVKHEIRTQLRKAKAGTREGREAAAASLRAQLAEARTSAKRDKLMGRIAKIEAGLK